MNVAEINPLNLPLLPLAERRNLPNCPAIYFVMQGDRVIYIGKTASLTQRWMQHHKWQQFSEIPDDLRIAWLECSDISLLHSIETALISHFDPIFNRGKSQHLGSKKLNAVIPDETWEELEQIAKGEMRTKSQMAAILLAEAIAVRRGTRQKSSEGDRTQPPPPTPDNGEASQTEPPKQGQRQMSKRGKGKEG